MDEHYRWDDHTYDTVNAAGVDWRDVFHVLHAHPRIRRHIGATLRVAAPARNGRWLTIACIEETDDTYLIVGVRWLDDDEVEAARKMLERGTS